MAKKIIISIILSFLVGSFIAFLSSEKSNTTKTSSEIASSPYANLSSEPTGWGFKKEQKKWQKK